MTTPLSPASYLTRPAVQRLLTRIWAEAEATDRTVLPRARDAASPLGPFSDRAVQHVLRDAFMAIDRPTAHLLYMLTRAKRPRLVVEFGTSFGISTLHLAAAVLDGGAGRVISTELEPHKLQRARAHLEEAGVASVVELREGDALQTLSTLDEPIELLFLDGWKELYLPLLQKLEPQLAKGALIVADDLDVLPEVLQPYLDYVRDPAHGYLSVEVPIGDKVEVSTWLGR